MENRPACPRPRAPATHRARQGRTRRAVLAGALAAAAAPLMPRRAWAAGAPMMVGDVRIRVFSDGDRTLPLGFLYSAVPEDELAALFAEAGVPVPDPVPTPNNVTLIESGSRLVLVDAGSGPNFDPATGVLEQALADEGFDPGAITDVVFTHGHPDHFWGALDDFEEEPRFPNARLLMAEAEIAYWRDYTSTGPEDFRTGFALGANRTIDTLGDRLEAVPLGEFAPGIRLEATPGHTPGHLSVLVESSGAAALVLGDALTNPLISFRRPDWPMNTDADPAAGAATRSRLLDMLSADRIPLVGFHLPYPGVGTVRPHPRGGYAFVPEVRAGPRIE